MSKYYSHERIATEKSVSVLSPSQIVRAIAEKMRAKQMHDKGLERREKQFRALSNMSARELSVIGMRREHIGAYVFGGGNLR